MTGDQEEAQRNSRGYPRLYRSFLTYSLIRAGFPGRLSKGDDVRYSRLKKKRKRQEQKGGEGGWGLRCKCQRDGKEDSKQIASHPGCRGWSEPKKSWPCLKCEEEESVCCLLYRHPPRRGTLTLFGSGMITYPLFVQCPSDTSRSSPAYAFFQYEKHVQAKAPCVQHAADLFHWLCFCWQKGSWTWQKMGWGISPLSRRACSESWRSSTTAPTPSPFQVLKGHVRAYHFFSFWYLHAGVTGAQSLGNTSGI